MEALCCWGRSSSQADKVVAGIAAELHGRWIEQLVQKLSNR